MSCRVLNSLGKERGWWRGLVLGIRRRTGGSSFVCTFVCVDELATSEEPHMGRVPPVSVSLPAGEVASSPGVEHLHVGSIFRTSPLSGTDFVPASVFPSLLDGPASDMAESIIHAIVSPRCGDEGQW